MVETEVIWNKVEEKFQPVCVNFTAKLLETSLTSKSGKDRVIGDGIGRADNVLLAPVRQSVRISRKRWLFQRFRSGPGTRRPNSHQPDMSKTESPPLRELSIGNFGKSNLPVLFFGQLQKPAACIDLVK